MALTVSVGSGRLRWHGVSRGRLFARGHLTDSIVHAGAAGVLAICPYFCLYVVKNDTGPTGLTSCEIEEHPETLQASRH